MNFDINAERAEGNVWVIALSGEVDLYTAPEFKETAARRDRAGRDLRRRRPDRHDLHRLDDARRPRRRGQEAAARGRPALDSSAATATSPRSSRSPGSTGYSRSTPTEPGRWPRPASPRRSGTSWWACGSSPSWSPPARCWPRGAGGGEEVTGQDGANRSNGKTLFVSGADGNASCGSCHTLLDAGTAGTVGPNLDQALGYGCSQGSPRARPSRSSWARSSSRREPCPPTSSRVRMRSTWPPTWPASPGRTSPAATRAATRATARAPPLDVRARRDLAERSPPAGVRWSFRNRRT